MFNLSLHLAYFNIPTTIKPDSFRCLKHFSGHALYTLKSQQKHMAVQSVAFIVETHQDFLAVCQDLLHVIHTFVETWTSR